MRRRFNIAGAIFIAMAGTFTASFPALADFASAVKSHQVGEHEKARAEFASLAELGDANSQYNLGAMFLQGQGGPKDEGIGAGWLMAALAHGHPGVTESRLNDTRSKLTPQQLQAAQSIVDQYGPQGIKARLTPSRDVCPQAQPPKLVEMSKLLFPAGMRMDGRDGVVIVAITVGADGLVRDPEILMAVPETEVEWSAISAAMKSRFQPAVRNGTPIEYRNTFKFVYAIDGGGALWNLGAVKKVRAAAEQADPEAQYLLGLVGLLDSGMNISRQDSYNLIFRAARGGQPRAQRFLARELGEFNDCSEWDKSDRWQRSAALRGEPSAQVMWARRLLAGSPQPEHLAEAKQLLEAAAQSKDPYAIKHAVGVMAASPHADLRNNELARRSADRLLGTWGKYDPQAFEASAAVYAASGRFRDATSQQAGAIKKARELKWNTQLMEERLAAYRAGTVWTGDLFALKTADNLPPPTGITAEVCGEQYEKQCEPRKPDAPKEPETPIGTRIPK